MKVLSILAITALVLHLLNQSGNVTKLKNELENSNMRLESLKEDIQISLRILNRPCWYVIHENKISSMPNGQGEIVNLSDRSLLPIKNQLGIKRPYPNTKIYFLPSESMEQICTVAGGLLTYEYLDD